MRYLRAFGRFWWDFIVGDTPEIAVGALAILVAAALLHHLRDAAVVVVPLAVVALLVGSALRGRSD